MIAQAQARLFQREPNPQAVLPLYIQAGKDLLQLLREGVDPGPIQPVFYFFCFETLANL